VTRGGSCETWPVGSLGGGAGSFLSSCCSPFAGDAGDQRRRRRERHRVPGPDRFAPERDRQVRLAVARPAEQQHDLTVGDLARRGQLADLLRVDPRLCLEVGACKLCHGGRSVRARAPSRSRSCARSHVRAARAEETKPAPSGAAICGRKTGAIAAGNTIAVVGIDDPVMPAFGRLWIAASRRPWRMRTWPAATSPPHLPNQPPRNRVAVPCRSSAAPSLPMMRVSSSP